MSDLLDDLAVSGPLDPDGEREQLRVIADDLIERGDSLGELVVVAIEREARDTPELARREDALIAEQQQRFGQRFDDRLPATYRWSRGLVDTVAFDSPEHDGVEALVAMAAEPAFRLLRRFVLSSACIDDYSEARPMLETLIAHASRFPRLVEVSVYEGPDLGNPWFEGPATIGDASALCTAFPRLEVLELEGVDTAFDRLDLPALRRLSLHHLEIDIVRVLLAARLPALADLELAIRYARGGNIAARIGPLLHKQFPALEALSIALPTDDAIAYLIDELPTCPLARPIRRLAFADAKLAERHHQQLLAHAPGLRRLERLELWGRGLSASMQRRLHRAYGGALVVV